MQTFATDPVRIHGLTENILSNLKQCEELPGVADITSRLSSLPTEIFDSIMAAVGPMRDLPREPTRALPQKWWRDQLKAGKDGPLPWLWDIDTAVIDAKASEPCPGRGGYEWDWELLVRQLSRGVDFGVRPNIPSAINAFTDCGRGYWALTGYHNEFPDVPAGLHNRRRIWQLLEEMFVGDMLPWALEKGDFVVGTRGPPVKRSMRMHWTKSGGVITPPKWLPSLHASPYGPFARRVGGEVYMIAGERPLQYWQWPKRGREEDGRPEPATVEEIREVLRKLDYPV